MNILTHNIDTVCTICKISNKQFRCYENCYNGLQAIYMYVDHI